jgi:hypothetical protein
MKEKKIKKESALKKKIKELKKTSRGKAILRLIKWCIFFLVLFIFLAIASLTQPKNNIHKPNLNEPEKPSNVPSKEETDNWNNETLTIETINRFQNYLSNKYDYKYEVTIKSEKYIYSGTKTKIENSGYKESSTGIIKYSIDNTGTYMETTTDKVMIDNLYEGLEESYLDPIYILNILKVLQISRDLECDCIEPVYKANDSKNIYKIITSNKNIIGINITALDFSYIYNLDFENIVE